MDSWNKGDEVQRISGLHNGMQAGDTGIVLSDLLNEVGIWGGGHDKQKFVLVRSAEQRQAAPAPPAPVVTARKDDSGKLDMNLLDDMPRAIKAVVEVMQWAIQKKEPAPYLRGSWQGVHPDRYRAAIKRHDRAACEQATADTPARLQLDDETGLLHLAHLATSALMALENVLREQEGHKS